jgi:hypothetical protein
MPRLLKKSWLDAFLEYADNSEIPRDYLTWAAISVLSSTIKNNIHIWYRGIKFSSNQYIILVGPPGLGKGEAIFKALDISEKANNINYIKDWNTPQEIIETLAIGFLKTVPSIQQTIGMIGPTGQLLQDHSATILAPELPVFLQSYDNMHALLCEWWNRNDFNYKTKNKGKFTINGLCVSLLGGCVPDYIRSLSKDRMAPITGGFTARTIFVYATEKYQLLSDNFGQPTVQINTLKDDLITDLQHIASLNGEMYLDQKARKLWNETYQKHNAKGGFDSDASANFKSRISSHVIKAAITISISESDSLIITRDQLERAFRIIESVRDKVDVVFRSVGESTLASSQAKVLDYIQYKGITTYKDILRFIYRDATEEQLRAILLIHVRLGHILENQVGSVVEYTDARTVTAKTKGVVIP